MRKMKKSIALLGLLIIACNSPEPPEDQETRVAAPTYDFYPQKQGQVTDYENLLSEAEEQALTRRILEVEDSAGFDIAIATVDTLPVDDGIVLFASELGNRWDIGSADEKNGLVIVLSNRQQQVGMATGKGLEPIFPDTVTRKIIDEEMLPFFSIGDHFKGLMKGVNAVYMVSRKGSSEPRK